MYIKTTIKNSSVPRRGQVYINFLQSYFVDVSFINSPYPKPICGFTTTPAFPKSWQAVKYLHYIFGKFLVVYCELF